MPGFFRVASRLICSHLLTSGLFTAMACYLLRGKFIAEAPLHPETMLLFGALILLQGAAALALRVLLLTGRATPAAKRVAAGEPLPCGSDRALGVLRDDGFVTEGAGPQGISLVKGGRRALVLEAACYAGLLVAVGCGMLNYGVGISGYMEVAPHSEWMGFVKNLKTVQRGFLVDLRHYDLKLRCDELSDAAPGRPSFLSLQVADRKGRILSSTFMKKGDRASVGGFQVWYDGDAYLVSPYITYRNRDLRTVPSFLAWKEGGDAYRGALHFHEDGTSGTAAYDPATKTFSFRVRTKEGAAGERRVQIGEKGAAGDFCFAVTSYGHLGRVQIRHHYYRTEIFSGLAVMLLALLGRVLLPPKRVRLWSEGEGTFFRTDSRRVRRMLRES